MISDIIPDSRIQIGGSVDNKNFMEKKADTTKNIKNRRSLDIEESSKSSPKNLKVSFKNNLNLNNINVNNSTDTNGIKKPKLMLKESMLYFDKNLKENIKYPIGYWKMERK